MERSYLESNPNELENIIKDIDFVVENYPTPK